MYKRQQGVVFAVVPADERIFLLGEGEEVVAALSHLSALIINTLSEKLFSDGKSMSAEKAFVNLKQ